ncbi:hypothetical protein HZC00_00720 [Candidatus Kaiserbacteria bacterium]|nr:hypothetical protein [Candidatus Kaiserbacteria bacterium]
MYVRIILGFIGFLGVMTGPWWVPLTCMVLLCIRWSAPEAVLMGLFLDLSWQGSMAATSWHTWPIFTALGLVFLWGLEPLRRRFLF